MYDPTGHKEYLIPQGLPKNTAPNPSAIWRSAKLSYKKSPSDKSTAEVTSDQFVAFLPGGVEALAALGQDGQALEMIAGGKAAAFSTQMDLLGAAVKTYGSNPALTAIEKYIQQSMRDKYEQFENGATGIEVLNQGLQFVQLSQATYPEHPEHRELRDRLTAKKTWLDRKNAVLRALLATGSWDAFLVGYSDFEKYQWSFPDMMERHQKALGASLEMHRKSGRERQITEDYRGAFREMKLASLRHPSDSGLQKELAVAWTEYSRREAVDHQLKVKQMPPGRREAIDQALHFARRYMEQKNLEEALKYVLEAEKLDPDWLPTLFAKAEVLAARNELVKALASLNEYDLRAVDNDRPPASKLRNELLFQLTNKLRDLKSAIEKAWADQGFYRVGMLARQGLRAKDDDPDLLYFAGVSALVTRQGKEGRSFLKRYLELSNTLDANRERRAGVYRLVGAIVEEQPAEQGEPNWLSGKKLPKGVYYCPISLAFQSRIQRIAASNKLKVEYAWDGNRLKSIVPVFEKNTELNQQKIFFAYAVQAAQVRGVGYEDLQPNAIPADPDEALKRSSVVLLNHSLVDPVMVQRLNGRDITVGVAGNRFFHPFVWERLHFFRMAYDQMGRVKSARLLPESKTAAGDDMVLEFEWSGLKLSTVKAYQILGGDEQKRVLIYERRLHYQDNRLVSEEIQNRGKVTQIKYTYNGDRLVSANCEKDESLDGRSREVTFF